MSRYNYEPYCDIEPHRAYNLATQLYHQLSTNIILTFLLVKR